MYVPPHQRKQVIKQANTTTQYFPELCPGKTEEDTGSCYAAIVKNEIKTEPAPILVDPGWVWLRPGKPPVHGAIIHSWEENLQDKLYNEMVKRHERYTLEDGPQYIPAWKEQEKTTRYEEESENEYTEEEETDEEYYSDEDTF